MRHFADALRLAGWSVTYQISDDFESSLNRMDVEELQEIQLLAEASEAPRSTRFG